MLLSALSVVCGEVSVYSGFIRAFVLPAENEVEESKSCGQWNRNNELKNAKIFQVMILSGFATIRVGAIWW